MPSKVQTRDLLGRFCKVTPQHVDWTVSLETIVILIHDVASGFLSEKRNLVVVAFFFFLWN